ncbi:2OG-Fe(II) oxygenase family protein [Conexibacter woesei]|uniref:2OG-Fe(II) oxygenase n=1 Tax=Conexibacter woesei (strain DSM 14684 / CCUG 47730 / CIP 108061 / JCM 11494 / NBRC 100937 / ID131577) TaxID=469383 RepID=D3F7L4_CONWI|nr:2OG-Fe(II) oxygenase family protein [Conexibacter woesei]ADB50876.1 2OG-Fe(II) oxygenase [Conexibacter woesei DSM 14684]
MLAQLDLAPLRDAGAGGSGDVAGGADGGDDGAGGAGGGDDGAGGGGTATRGTLARDVAAACRDDGGFVAVGHGLGAVGELLDLAPALFALDPAQLDAIRVNAAGRGYTPPGSGAKPGFAPDVKEAFQANTPQPPDLRGTAARFDGVNQWPALDGFRPAFERGLAELERFARDLLALVAVGSGLGAGAFDTGGAGARAGSVGRPAVTLRLHHYPPADDDGGRRFGAAPHTDYGALGLVAERPAVGGLEAQDAHGRWRRVDTPPGALVVIVGDLLAWWSGGRLRALPHRVPIPAGGSRYTLAAFVNPPPAALLRPHRTDDRDGADSDAVTTADFVARLADRRTTADDVSAQPS